MHTPLRRQGLQNKQCERSLQNVVLILGHIVKPQLARYCSMLGCEDWRKGWHPGIGRFPRFVPSSVPMGQFCVGLRRWHGFRTSMSLKNYFPKRRRAYQSRGPTAGNSGDLRRVLMVHTEVTAWRDGSVGRELLSLSHPHRRWIEWLQPCG